MSNADLTAVIDGDTKGLIEALKGATAEMKAFEQGTGQSLKNLNEAFAGSFGTIKKALQETKDAFLAFSPIAVFDLLHNQLEAGIKEWTKIGDAADKASVSTDFFQALAYKANQAHIETDKLAEGLTHFAGEMAKAKHGHGELVDEWKKDNKALLEIVTNAKTVEDGVKAVSNAMDKEDGVVEKARLAIQAFGKDHRDLYRVVGDGADSIAKAADEARRYGVLLDENFIRKAQESKDGFAAVSKVLLTEFRIALLEIAPLLQDVGRAAMSVSTAARQMRDVFVSSAEGLSNSGLNDQIKLHTQILEKLRAEIDRLQSGKGAGGFSIAEMFGFGPSDEEKLAKAKKAMEEELAFVKQFKDELAKRDKDSKEYNKSLNSDFFDNNGEDEKAKKRLLEGQQAMDDLMKQYYTDTHQYYQAIEMDAQREKDRFKLALEEKKINANQYSIAMVLIAKEEATKIEEAYDHTREHIRTAMQGISGEFEKILSDWQSGNKITLQSIEKDFVNMIERMVIKAAVLEPLFGTGKTGPGEFGVVGDAAKGVFGGSGGLSLGSITSVFGKLFHDGGTVGSGGPGRWVSPDTFAGAVRYHEGGIAGLMPGEVPAILQQGETVIPKGRGQAGRGHTFNFNIQTPDPGAFKASQSQLAAMISRAVAQGERNL